MGAGACPRSDQRGRRPSGELESLAKLRERGLLTDEEFATEEARLRA
jgi:hypothetical protein